MISVAVRGERTGKGGAIPFERRVGLAAGASCFAQRPRWVSAICVAQCSAICHIHVMASIIVVVVVVVVVV
jgi:hypothetical protein